MSAEGMRYRSDDADFADAIFEYVAARGFAVLVRNFYQRFVFRHASQDLVKSDDDFRSPDPIFLQRHEFDKAHDHAFFTREHAEGDDRKSTRLNSSHGYISYAVFCLKKKKR